MTETNKKTEEAFNKNVERLNKQVETTMKRAFFDLLELRDYWDSAHKLDMCIYHQQLL